MMINVMTSHASSTTGTCDNAQQTDGLGPQDEYASAIEHWCDFYDLLEDKDPNKKPPRLSGTMPWAQMLGHATDCAKKIRRATLMCEDEAKAAVAAVHSRDPLSVISTVYSDYATTVPARRSDNEKYKTFKGRFDAAVFRFRSPADDITTPEPLLAVKLVNNARMNDKQRISILTASAMSKRIETTSIFGNVSSSSSTLSTEGAIIINKSLSSHGFLCLLLHTSNTFNIHQQRLLFVKRKDHQRQIVVFHRL